MALAKTTKVTNPMEKKRYQFIVLGITIMMFLGTVYSYSVFRVSLEDVFMIGSALSGLPYMFALAFYAVFMLIIGKYMRDYHPRTLLFVGGYLVALSWILSSFVGNIYVLTLTYGLIGGAGVGIAYGVIMNIIAQWFPDKKGLATGLVLLGFGLSPLVTAPLARTLVESFGVMETFLILGMSFAIILPFLSIPIRYPEQTDLTHINVPKTDHSTEHNLTTKEMLATSSFKGVYFTFIIGTIIGLMLIGLTTSVGLDYFNLDADTVTLFVSLFAIFNGLGRPTFGYITDHVSTKFAMVLSYTLIITAALLVILFNQFPFIYVISFAIFWFNLGGWLAIAPASTLKLFGLWHYSQNYGVIFTAYGIGAIIGVLSSGLLLDLFGHYEYIFYYIIALAVVGLILIKVWMTPHENNKIQAN